MTNPHTPSAPAITTAQLDWSEDGTPVSKQFDDVYFSKHSGIDETRYVFLQNNDLPARLAAREGSDHPLFQLGETGFGTGLNFLCAWQLRDQLAPGCRLQFMSVEKYPLSLENLAQALAHWPELAPCAQRLLALYPPLTAGWHRLSFIEEQVELNLFIGDALAAFSSQSGHMDAWFLDGFAPAKNPDMWSAELFEQLVRLSLPGTTFSTFTAAGAVREGLREAGFEVTRVKGFGRKRHMLTGRLLAPYEIAAAPTAQPPSDPSSEPLSEPLANSLSGQHPGEPVRQAVASPPLVKAPWFIIPRCPGEIKRAIVIGGGLAGTSAAFSLAQRHWQVSLFERHHQLAQEASGNAQGILYTKLSAQPSLKSDFYTSGYLYSLQQLAQLLPLSAEAAGSVREWDACGVLQLAYSDKELARQQQFLTNSPQPETLVYPVDSHQASVLAGVELAQGGLFFPQAGWARPGALCSEHIKHPAISLTANAEIDQLIYQDQQWHLLDQRGNTLARAPVAIIANANQTLRFEQSQFLPLKRIRGQITQLPATDGAPLKTVVCGNAYISPPHNGQYHLGATFNLGVDTAVCRAEDHLSNIAQISALIPALAEQQHWQQLNAQLLQGRVAFRCTTPDYLPLVGPLPKQADFMAHYQRLRHDATSQFSLPGSYHPGLYLTTGHGSKGLTSCPLAGELLASMICNEPLPLDREMVNALNPARFLIRDLIRNKL